MMQIGTRGQAYSWSQLIVLQANSSHSSHNRLQVAGGGICWTVLLVALIGSVLVNMPSGWLGAKGHRSRLNPALVYLMAKMAQGWLLSVCGAILLLFETDFEGPPADMFPFDHGVGGLLVCLYTILALLILNSPAWAAVLALQANVSWFSVSSLFVNERPLNALIKTGVSMVFLGSMSLLIVLINEFVPPHEGLMSLDAAKLKGRRRDELFKSQPHFEFATISPFKMDNSPPTSQTLNLEKVTYEKARYVFVGVASLPVFLFDLVKN